MIRLISRMSELMHRVTVLCEETQLAIEKSKRLRAAMGRLTVELTTATERLRRTKSLSGLP